MPGHTAKHGGPRLHFSSSAMLQANIGPPASAQQGPTHQVVDSLCGCVGVLARNAAAVVAVSCSEVHSAFQQDCLAWPYACDELLLGMQAHCSVELRGNYHALQARDDAQCRSHRTVQTSLDNPLSGWWQESPTVCPGPVPEQAGPHRTACRQPAAASCELYVVAAALLVLIRGSLAVLREAFAHKPLMLSWQSRRLRATAMRGMLPKWPLKLRMRGPY